MHKLNIHISINFKVISVSCLRGHSFFAWNWDKELSFPICPYTNTIYGSITLLVSVSMFIESAHKVFVLATIVLTFVLAPGLTYPKYIWSNV